MNGDKPRVRGRWWFLVIGALLPAFGGSGCQSMNNTEGGLLGGGAIGAALGALAAGPRHALAGALIGGAAGATVGGVAGNNADRAEQRAANQQAAVAAAVARQQMSLQDIVQLTGSGSSDTIIINQIRTSGSVYNLSAADLQYLQNNGVREPVITAMQATATMPRQVYVGRPPPVYVYPAPPPPPVVGVGVYRSYPY